MPQDSNQPLRPPRPSGSGSHNADDIEALKSAQKLVIAASLMGPFALIFGGMLLSGAAVVCAVLALRKIQLLISAGSSVKTLAQQLRTACIVALVISSLVFSLSVASAVMMYPVVEEALRTGDYSKLLGPDANLPGSGIPDGSESSTWG